MSTIKERETKRRWKRKIYIIDKQFQLKFMITWLLMMLGFIIIILAVMFLSIRLFKVLPVDERFILQIGYILKYNGLFIVFLTIFIALYMIFLSHKIAGPAYRLSKLLQEMKEGKYDFYVQLRKNDYLKSIANSLNEYIENQNIRYKGILQLRDKLISIKDSITDESVKQKLIEIIEAIEENIKNIRLRRNAD